MNRCVAAFTAIALSSCSLIGTETPPPVETWTKRSDCNHGYARPGADTILAGVGVLGAVAGVGIITNPTPGATDPTSNAAGGVTMLSAGALAATLFAISAAIGYSRVGACVDALARWKAAHPEDVQPDEIPVETIARRYLQCSAGELQRESISFGRNNGPADPYRWANMQFAGCGRAIWCGEGPGGVARCAAPADLEVAIAQLAVETGCEAQSIVQLQRYVTQTPGGRHELFGQSTYRVEACGQRYSCTVPLYAPYDNEPLLPSAAQGGVACKQAPGAISVPPPPPLPPADEEP